MVLSLLRQEHADALVIKVSIIRWKKANTREQVKLIFPRSVNFPVRFSVIAAAVELLDNIYSAHYLLILFVDQQTVSLARVLLERY